MIPGQHSYVGQRFQASIPQRRLTSEDEWLMRELHREGAAVELLAEHFGCSVLQAIGVCSTRTVRA